MSLQCLHARIRFATKIFLAFPNTGLLQQIAMSTDTSAFQLTAVVPAGGAYYQPGIQAARFPTFPPAAGAQPAVAPVIPPVTVEQPKPTTTTLVINESGNCPKCLVSEQQPTN
jgi:hypothetical protein